jgi:2-succinyl-5-enolpyruvyl-6-hydroxy-3-cyclohexene-1-carboxylate synthase
VDEDDARPLAGDLGVEHRLHLRKDVRVSEAATTQATFCATLVDEWARAGVAHAAVAPGSRSTPMALALAADERVAVHVFHDERCAAFAALGAGRATGVPAVVLCTSGTAGTHLHAAVVEAHQARVPMLAVTADRPPELRDVGAPQTIDQQHLYGRAVRWFVDPGVPDDAARWSWRPLAARALDAAVTGAGPVHLNLPFREPLVGTPGELPPPRLRSGGEGRASAPGHRLRFEPRRPLVVASRPVDLPGVPVLADPRSGIAGGVRHADALLRVPFLAEELRPDLVVRVGPPPASRVVNEWLAASGAVEVCDEAGWDPYGTVAAVGTVESLPAPEPGWTERWLELDAAADDVIAKVLAAATGPTEPGTARDLLASLPPGAHLVVASSMPVRDLEWYATPRPDVTVHANRGANGIDGTISTAIGVALATGAPTAVLVGDVAFLHDVGALVGLPARGVDVRIVVVDNDGGGIFSFLPQAAVLDHGRFEQLFGTPHGVDVAAVAAAFGVDVTVVRTDREANRRLHGELHAAVAAAVRAVSG